MSVVDTISHFFSSKQGEGECVHHEITPVFLPEEDGLKLSDVLNYVKDANDDSLSNASSNDVLTELDPPPYPPFLDPIDHSGGSGENFGG